MLSDQIKATLEGVRKTLEDAGFVRPLTWYEKMFLVVFDFFSSVGFALGFIFAGLLMAPLGGIWEGVVRGIDAARALVVVDDDDEESE